MAAVPAPRVTWAAGRAARVRSRSANASWSGAVANSSSATTGQTASRSASSVAIQRASTLGLLWRFQAEVSNTSGSPEPYGSARGMQLLGDSEVVTVVLTGGDPPQMLVRFAPRVSLSPKRLCTTQREIPHDA